MLRSPVQTVPPALAERSATTLERGKNGACAPVDDVHRDLLGGCARDALGPSEPAQTSIHRQQRSPTSTTRASTRPAFSPESGASPELHRGVLSAARQRRPIDVLDVALG